MSKEVLLKRIEGYRAKHRELIGSFMREKDIDNAREMLDESKRLAKTIDELEKSYKRLVAKERHNNKTIFVNELRNIVIGL